MSEPRLEDDDSPHERWERDARARLGMQAPFTLLMDFALGLTSWARDTGEADIENEPTSDLPEMPLVCLVGLALYVAAQDQRIAGINQIQLPYARELLLDDEHARRIATTQPGLDYKADGRLRDDDHQALLAALADTDRWQRLRQQAITLFDDLIKRLGGPDSRGHGPALYMAIGSARHAPVRRSWYDKPELTALVGAEEGRSELL